MLKSTKLTTTLTIVFLILIKNVAQIGSYAATNNFATFEDNIENNNINNNNNDETHRLTKRMDLESCLGKKHFKQNIMYRIIKLVITYNVVKFFHSHASLQMTHNLVFPFNVRFCI